MQIRPANLDDLPDLAALLAGAGMTGTPELLKWKLFDAPGPDRPRSFVAIVDGQIAGHIGVMPASLIHADEVPVEGGWFVDWMVREDLRGRAIGVFLLREALRHWPLLMTIQGTADTREALQQLGWTRVDAPCVFKLNLQAGAMNPDSPAWDRFKAELGRRLYYHPVNLPAPDGWQLIAGQSDDSSASWSHLGRCCVRVGARIESDDVPRPARFAHDAALLRHYFADHPEKQYRLLVAADGHGPAAYALWRLCPRPDGRDEGRIVDLAAPWDRTDVWAWLVSAATSTMAAAGPAQAQCLAAENSPLAYALKTNRYLGRQSLPLWLSPGEASPVITSKCHITLADSDIDTASTV